MYLSNTMDPKFLDKQQFVIGVGLSERFAIDLAGGNGTVRTQNLFPANRTNVEFSQFNHRLEGQYYQWGYAVQYAFATDSRWVRENVVPFDEKGFALIFHMLAIGYIFIT